MKIIESNSISPINLPCPDDEACAQNYISAILNINEDLAIEPGELGGLSQILGNGCRTLGELRR